MVSVNFILMGNLQAQNLHLSICTFLLLQKMLESFYFLILDKKHFLFTLIVQNDKRGKVL